LAPLFSFQLKHLYGKLPTGQGIYKQDMSYSLSLLPPLALGAGLASGGFFLALGLHQSNIEASKEGSSLNQHK
jgi:hypothetical protein